MKTNFIRKPRYEDLIPQNEFLIEKKVTLSNEEFEKFIKNPLNDYAFIADNKEFMFLDNDVWHVVLIQSESLDYGILVESEGSNYARYASYISLVGEKFND